MPDVAGLRTVRCEAGGLRTEVWSVRSAVRCEVGSLMSEVRSATCEVRYLRCEV